METFRVLQYGKPLYIHELLSAYQPTVTLRSQRQNRLAVPTTLNRTVLASRVSQNYAPTIWNNLE